MKVTNFEISRKLEEIGFKAETDFFYDERGDIYHIKELEKSKAVVDCMAFDLETLISALPETIRNDSEELIVSKKDIGYYFSDHGEDVCLTGVDIEERETMASACGNLLILLHEKGLIKFDK